ncbi:MAG: family 1 glycosylhydrolase [Candidatus Moraniibacteriota bacterium]
MLASLRTKGIEPFVTLWHWTLPSWLAEQGGVLAPEFAWYFARFAAFVGKEFGDSVTYFITLNEPDVLAAHAYLKGVWPPQEKSVLKYFRALKALSHAHRLSYRVLKEQNSDFQIGIAKHQVAFEMKTPTLLNRLLKKLAEFFWNDWFLRQVKGTQDFIGLNHYNRNVIANGYGKNPNQVQTDFGWEYWPESLETALVELKKYALPIYVTENGLADSTDRLRPDFIPRALAAAERAIEQGVDLRGYFYWSLLDNFEWDKGFWPRFGLVEVDFATQKRSLRPSARLYAQIAEKNGLEKPS